MSKKIFPLTIFLFFTVSLIAGGDSRKNMNYKEWSAADVEKILSDSPWSRPVVVTRSWPKYDNHRELEKPGPRGAEELRSRSTTGPIKIIPQDVAQFVVRWQSSLVVRQALIREAELRGGPVEKAEELLSSQPEAYIITIFGLDMTPFRGIDENYLEKNSYVMVKKTKEKLAPSRVEIQPKGNQWMVGFKLGYGWIVGADQRNPQGRPVVLYFKKKTASGADLLPGDATELLFYCATPLTSIEADFDLRKMHTAKDGPDL